MAEMERQGSALAGVTLEGNDFASLLKKEFKPKTDEAKSAVEQAVQTLAQQALANTALRSTDAVRTIEAMIAALDKRLTEQVNKIIHHEDFQRLESASSTSSKATAAAASRARSQAVAEIREAHEQVLRDEPLAVPAQAEAPDETPALGSRVRVATLGVVGEVVELHGERELEVAVGGKRLRVPRSAVSVLERAAAPKVRVAAPQKSGNVPAEINLVGLRVDEAVPMVDKLLDDAALSERREIRVIHGFGQGKLRKAIAELLDGHPHVSSFRPGGPREGGAGATVVELKD